MQRRSQFIVVNAVARNANRIEMPKRAGKTNAVKLVGTCPELSDILSGSQSLAAVAIVALKVKLSLKEA